MDLVAARSVSEDGSWTGPVRVVDDGSGPRVEHLPPGSPVAEPDVDFVLPEVFDASLRCRGYREDASGEPFGPTRAILALNGRYGVGAFKESGNSWEALRHLVDVVGERRAVLSGPVLVEGEPVDEIERPITASTAALAAEVAALEGATWLMLGPTIGPAVLSAVASAAGERDLRLAARPGRSPLAELARRGVAALHGAHRLLPNAGSADAVDLILRWAEATPSEVAEEVGPVLLNRGIAVVPELIATRRSILLEEAVRAEALEDLAPILPASRYLLEMRRAGGQVVGRRQMVAHGALARLRRTERLRAEHGLAKVLEFTAALASAGVQLWPGSGAPALGVVPGAGYWEELRLLSSHDVPLGSLLQPPEGFAPDWAEHSSVVLVRERGVVIEIVRRRASSSPGPVPSEANVGPDVTKPPDGTYLQ